ncbi:MAG: hypothetical protein NUV65_02935 [Candidatus Roizmanbacteria bacterium]|nr:hypothetical protein [Candidatus Roizmanbacteria bacterium]
MNTQFEEQKDIVQEKILGCMIKALRDGTLKVDESRASAQFVLSKIDSVGTSQELLALLQELSTRWKVYESVLLEEKGKQIQSEDTDQIKQVQQKLQKFL